MGRRKKQEGICCLCGVEGPLSFEHVPPRTAFNGRRVVSFKGMDTVKLGPGESIRGSGRIQQRGAGGHTLCPRCNNETGGWYAGHFVEWCYQAAHILERSGGRPSLIYFYHIYPLRILKQITAMFCSVAGPELAEKHSGLRRFLLNKQARCLPRHLRFFVYFNTKGKARFAGVTGMMNLESRRMTMLTEISFPPLGYVLTIDSEPPDDRLVEITHFSRFGYLEYHFWGAHLPVLETHLMYPGDYRSRGEIEKQAEASRKYMESD